MRRSAAAIPNGDYRCRVTKLGARSAGLLPYVAYPAFNCRIAASGRLQAFTKLSGSQRQVGYIFPHDQLRTVFLGTLVLGDEQRARARTARTTTATSPAMSSGSGPIAGG